MPMERALLEAILADPDDDAPRLIFADWLDDHGDSDRAEFIRVQCALARMDEDDGRYDIYKAREVILLARHWRTWLGPAFGRASHFTFRRGFLQRLLTSVDSFLDIAEELFLWAPAPFVVLYGLSETLPRLASRPGMDRVTGVEFSPTEPFAADDLEAFLMSPRLTGLRELTIPQSAGGRFVAGRLAETPCLPALRRLALPDGRLRPADVAALARSPHRQALEELDLQGCELDRAAAEALAQAEGLPRLASLGLSRTVVPQEGLRALARSNRLTALVKINLSGSALGRRQLVDLAESPLLGRLRALDLSYNTVRAGGMEAILASGSKQLAELDLTHCALADGAARVLVPHALPHLKTLRLAWNNLSAVGAERLASAEGLSGLRHLDLTGNRLDDGGVVSLIDAPFSPQLYSLGLAHTAAGSIGALALAATARLGRLRSLRLASNGIGNAGTEALARPNGLTGLRELRLDETSIDDRAVRFWEQSWLLGRLHFLSLGLSNVSPSRYAALADAARAQPALFYLMARSPGARHVKDVFGDRISVLNTFGWQVDDDDIPF